MYDYAGIQKLIEDWEIPMLHYAGCFSAAEQEKQESVRYSFSMLLKGSRDTGRCNESATSLILLKNVRARMAELKKCSPQQLSKYFHLQETREDDMLAGIIGALAPAEQEILLLKFRYLCSCEEIGEIMEEEAGWIANQYECIMEHTEAKFKK